MVPLGIPAVLKAVWKAVLVFSLESLFQLAGTVATYSKSVGKDLKFIFVLAYPRSDVRNLVTNDSGLGPALMNSSCRGVSLLAQG